MMDIFNFGAETFFSPLNPMVAMFNFAWGSDRADAATVAQGGGRPVLVIPGFGATGAATAYFRETLSQLGYEVYDWDGGMNVGLAGDLSQRMLPLSVQLRRIYAEHGERVAIVGWSMGGNYAYALRNRHPDLVGDVISLGTPADGSECVADSSKSDIVLRAKRGAGKSSKSVGRHAPRRSLSVYSKSDGVVDWVKSILPEVAGHRNVEVMGVDHFGMVYHPRVLRLVGEFLAGGFAA